MPDDTCCLLPAYGPIDCWLLFLFHQPKNVRGLLEAVAPCVTEAVEVACEAINQLASCVLQVVWPRGLHWLTLPGSHHHPIAVPSCSLVLGAPLLPHGAHPCHPKWCAWSALLRDSYETHLNLIGARCFCSMFCQIMAGLARSPVICNFVGLAG